MGYFSELQIGGKLDYIASRTNFKPAAAAGGFQNHHGMHA
jgi:hypothetical protein